MGLKEQVAARFGNATRHGVTDASLTRITPGVRTPGAVSGGTNPTTTVHTCKGAVRSFDADRIDGTTVLTDDRVINLLAATITPAAVPRPGDTVTIEGATYRILSVRRRGFDTLYECHGRK